MTNPSSAESSVAGRHNEGHGRRLTAAFEALEAFPALAESRNRVLRVVREDRASVGEVVAAVESDVALVITVLRIANRTAQRKKGKIASIPEAVEILSPEGVETLAARTATFDFFERTPGWDVMPERFRLHAVATQAAADRLARELEYEDRDELLVLGAAARHRQARAQPRLPGLPVADPRRRAHARGAHPQERLELGVDHALVGGVLARRWALPNRLAIAIERHHADDADGEAALVRLADMLAHYGHAQPVNPKALLQAARACDLSTDQLRAVMYELPQGIGSGQAQRRPLPALDARGRGAQAPGRGQGLQADRPRARALHEHGAHAPPQHLREARRRGPRAGRPDRHRARLDLA